MICVFEIVNTDTLESEVLTYFTEINNERYEKLNQKLQQILPPSKHYKFRWSYFDTDWDDEDVIFEAIQAAMES